MMETPFPFEPLLVFGALAVMLLIGVFLRAVVPFFQRFLIPSCLIGGVLGMILLNVKLIDLPAKHFESFAYHFFIISFISVGLTRGNPGRSSDTHGRPLKGAVWMALVEGVTISLQTVIGFLFVLIFGLFGTMLFPTFGFFLPLGFTEGPGQALSFGKVWEGFGFEHAATIGLTFATIGFFFAFFVGVPLVNWGVKKGLSKSGPTQLTPDLLKGMMTKNQQKEPAGEQTMHSGNIDTLAFQIALVGLVYVLTYGFVALLNGVLPPEESKTIWGFFFFFGMVIAIILRGIASKLGLDYLIDPGVQRRITGWAIDFLIVSTVMAIQLAVVAAFILPIAFMSVASGIVTTAAVLYLGRRLDSLNLERTVSIFGTCTGTVPSGLLLLRIADPQFRTPVALEIGLMNIFAAPIILMSMLLINAPVVWGWSIWVTALAHAGLLGVSLVLIKLFKCWGAPRF